MIKQFRTDSVCVIHSHLIRETGGTDGVRDNSLLESALSSPFQSFGGQEIYPDVIQKACRLGVGIIKNHPFLDGNKRIGCHMMLIFLALNGIEVDCDPMELADIIVGVASSKISFEELCEWVKSK